MLRNLADTTDSWGGSRKSAPSEAVTRPEQTANQERVVWKRSHRRDEATAETEGNEHYRLAHSASHKHID